jgi:hypothetical protein
LRKDALFKKSFYVRDMTEGLKDVGNADTAQRKKVQLSYD